MQEAFREAAKSNPGSSLAREVGNATHRAKRDKHIQFVDGLAGDWEALGSKVFQWDYVRSWSNEPFWKLRNDLSRLHTRSIGLSPDEQTGMLAHFAFGLKISEEKVDPIIRKINGTRPLPEVLGDPHSVISSPTLSPVSDLFLHHYTFLSGYEPQLRDSFRTYVMDRCVRDGVLGYIGLPLVLPASAEWIWRR
ncbi:hypothetical protein A3F00_05440 [Candidatus Daviesbacteria bacterium RIFCSPHIGHO2_12_FULL_37_11]|uniref:Uncharacterized protein n=1 Tax=Candidatus Daviesbacteria bacterium RIFCSPHIGHO2_12_FULL_37_11 TaxID=1797777 RepID=A0A1F5KC35_9BACT|nr:MAG: hypothetical protein A2769_00645 [Candidatus Daviesbacteria bacterium RIFCSPHIGHO2_01_FULL_37_27]OGE38493.1 MAG: hypothetical protein A3F00_05440 [Candidatus Daviesbacteria bacterium RIFCSPHIGHO2_12_FULL_37_11]OGE45708.1 MAG: hypothetical protein A3B39_05305 [Candidatus Daviesbacteria bacterium RIFCSPLOWO2_01_FULL_37_10]